VDDGRRLNPQRAPPAKPVVGAAPLARIGGGAPSPRDRGLRAREVWALNKPAGVVSTAREPGKRRAVTELVDSRRRLYPVGRLDAESTGLILLTNDGELANRLSHPRFEVDRTYRAAVAGGPVSERALRALREGVELDDGPTAPARARRLGHDVIELTIHEGRKRQVKRMCAAVGHPVRRLARTSFGPLRLDGLEEGGHRRLTPAEVERLRKAAGEPAEPPAARAGAG
jgi:23S rRNA pseudouridine2605 synthase